MEESKHAWHKPARRREEVQVCSDASAVVICSGVGLGGTRRSIWVSFGHDESAPVLAISGENKHTQKQQQQQQQQPVLQRRQSPGCRVGQSGSRTAANKGSARQHTSSDPHCLRWDARMQRLQGCVSSGQCALHVGPGTGSLAHSFSSLTHCEACGLHCPGAQPLQAGQCCV